MFSAARFVVAAAIVALFGGVLLAGLLIQPIEETAPAAATDSPDPAANLLPGVDLVTEEVEPGVYRVLHDGVRDLEWELEEASTQPQQPAVVATDDGVWLAVAGDGLRLGDPGSSEVAWDTDRPGDVVATGPSTVRLVPGERGEIAWTRAGPDRTLYRLSPAGREIFTADDDTPVFTGDTYNVGPRTAVAPDGAGWFSLEDDFGRNPVVSSDCGGLVRYDGRRSTYFLQDRGFCVAGLDIDARGYVWVLGWSHGDAALPDGGVSSFVGPTSLYAITPEAVAGIE